MFGCGGTRISVSQAVAERLDNGESGGTSCVIAPHAS